MRVAPAVADDDGILITVITCAARALSSAIFHREDKGVFFSFLISRRVDGVDWRIRGDGYERGLIIVWIGREILSLRGGGFVKLKCVNGLSLLRREKDICWFIQARSADAKSFQNSRHYG